MVTASFLFFFNADYTIILYGNKNVPAIIMRERERVQKYIINKTCLIIAGCDWHAG